MWAPILDPGRLVLLHGPRSAMRAFHLELAHAALGAREGNVLWCDGDHGFNPYDFAEWNLEHGLEAEAEADRVLVKRCMTPFQWDTVLTKHLDAKLSEAPAAMVLAAPYDALFSTDELQDWEQEDYVRFSLRHLASLARRRRVPILLSVDMARWWRTHPILARATYEGAGARWSVTRLPEGWRARQDGSEGVIETLARGVTLRDFLEEPRTLSVSASRRPKPRDPF